MLEIICSSTRYLKNFILKQFLLCGEFSFFLFSCYPSHSVGIQGLPCSLVPFAFSRPECQIMHNDLVSIPNFWTIELTWCFLHVEQVTLLLAWNDWSFCLLSVNVVLNAQGYRKAQCLQPMPKHYVTVLLSIRLSRLLWVRSHEQLLSTVVTRHPPWLTSQCKHANPTWCDTILPNNQPCSNLCS